MNRKVTVILLMLVMLIGFSASALAQGRQITGTVTSAEDGQALPGVTVLIKEAPNRGASLLLRSIAEIQDGSPPAAAAAVACAAVVFVLSSG